MSHLADESNRSCLLDLMSTVQVSSTSADTGVHKVLPSRGKPGLPRATGPRMLCRSAEAFDSYECVCISRYNLYGEQVVTLAYRLMQTMTHFA